MKMKPTLKGTKKIMQKSNMLYMANFQNRKSLRD